MKRLFDKDEIWFAVLWIVIYVVSFGNADSLSDRIGIPKAVTVIVGIVLTVILIRFIRKYQLSNDYGLCKVKSNLKNYLYFVPLIIISSVNFWNGLTKNDTVLVSVLYIISMCFVGFLEEIIFRGFLFRGMVKNNVTSAIIVSSVTFGVGHIVNILLGKPVFSTMLQLIYASAIGFCYTVIFYVSGSILPCILSHAFVNATSVFAVEPTEKIHIRITVMQTMISIVYGVWLLYVHKERQKQKG